MTAQHPDVECGCVYWITGLTGAGKTTVAAQLVTMLRAVGRPVLFLDGDVMRDIFPGGDRHSPQDRLRLSLGYARLCKEVSAQGIEVVCATVSMSHEVRRWNREHIPVYREIYLEVPKEELKQRDSKGFYRAFEEGRLRDMVGLDVAAELPESPDMTISNYKDVSPLRAAEKIWDAFIAPSLAGRER